MMDKTEIIDRLRRIARHAVHTIGEEPFIMSIDDGTAVCEAIDIIQQTQRTGHWIKWGNRVKCDQCALTNKYSKPFCPNCGVRMEGKS